MAIKFGWFDVPLGGDESKYTYSANEMRDLWRSMLTNGIVPETRITSSSTIVPSTQLGASFSAATGQGLKITINKGIAWIDGAYIIATQPEQIDLVAGWTNDIVLRLDTTGSDVVCGIFNKQRSGASIEAGLTRSGGIYELGLHTVTIPTGTTQITTSMIQDQRLNISPGADGLPCCGIVGSLMQPDVSKWYDNAIDTLEALQAQNQATFDDWFSQLEDTLDQDTAGNLLNLINTKSNKSTLTTKTLSKTSWTGSEPPDTYSLSVSGVTTTSVQEILPTTSATEEQITALQAANMQDGGQSAGKITIKAWGDKPEIDLPVRIIIRGDL